MVTRKITYIFLAILWLYTTQIYGQPSAASWDSFGYFPPMNVVYHPVSTKNREAQKAFDRGLLAIYAFNHDQAYFNFQKASEIDPSLAMAYWGMALALGENINTLLLQREKKRQMR